MFDRAGLISAVRDHGRVARVVIAAHDGSSPREVGAAMLVWAGGQSGTIGGGALEHAATERARAMLPTGGRRLDRAALGPELGQCCGGRVTLLTEIHDSATVRALPDDVVARPVEDARKVGPDMPLAVHRILTRARSQGILPVPVLLQGWFVEPVAVARRQVWVWGAGHVGRAVVGVLAGLTGVSVTWVDVAAARFPDPLPDGVQTRIAPDPATLVPAAPIGAEHLVLTFSHALDLALCHALLGHGFRRLGLIGSATKWARFRSRLAALGHDPSEIARIQCPIGEPALGKEPQAIAIGVAAAFLRDQATAAEAVRR